MRFSAVTLLVCSCPCLPKLGGLEADGRANNSETAFPLDHQVQEHAPGRRRDQGYGSAMDVKHQLVFSVYLWSAIGLQLHSW